MVVEEIETEIESLKYMGKETRVEIQYRDRVDWKICSLQSRQYSYTEREERGRKGKREREREKGRKKEREGEKGREKERQYEIKRQRVRKMR